MYNNLYLKYTHDINKYPPLQTNMTRQIQYTSLNHAAYIVSVCPYRTHPLVLSSLKFMARFDIGEFILLFSLKNRFWIVLLVAIVRSGCWNGGGLSLFLRFDIFHALHTFEQRKSHCQGTTLRAVGFVLTNHECSLSQCWHAILTL